MASQEMGGVENNQPLVETHVEKQVSDPTGLAMEGSEGPLYLALVPEDEMGVVDQADVQDAKSIVAYLHEQYPDEVEALAGKDKATVLAKLTELKDRQMAA